MTNNIYERFLKFIKNNIIYILIFILVLFLFYYELPYVIYKSGGTINISERLEIPKDYKEEGSFNMSYVTSMKGTIPFVLLSYIIPDWDLYKIEEVTSQNDYETSIRIGREFLNEGIDNAIIAAFNEAGYSIKITDEKIKVIYKNNKSKSDIEIGDEITKINDTEVKTFDDIKTYINSLKENEKVRVYVTNNGKEYERYAYIYHEKEDDSLKIGVAFHTFYKYETEIPVKIKMKGNESGSSGGLMMSLAIYNALTDEDITHGNVIVGTGSIDKDGKVSEIGGIKYKLLAAHKKNAQVFFVPKENYEEAIKVKNERNIDIDIVSVSTLKDAIDYLKGK